MNGKKSKLLCKEPAIDIKKEIALSILNIGEILAKTIDYYSLKDEKDDLTEFINVCNEQAILEKQHQFNSVDTAKVESKENLNEFEKDSIPIIDDVSSIQSEIDSFEEIIKTDKKSSYSLKHLIHEVDKKIKILNGIFYQNEYENFDEPNDLKVLYRKSNNSACIIRDSLSRDNFSYLYERSDLYDEMKELTNIMNDLNFVIDKNEKNKHNYGSFI